MTHERLPKRRSAKRAANVTVQTNLRIKEWLRREMEDEAKDKGVSLNSIMVDRLSKPSLISKVVCTTIAELRQLGFVGPSSDNVARLIRERTGGFK